MYTCKDRIDEFDNFTKLLIVTVLTRQVSREYNRSLGPGIANNGSLSSNT